jgi:DNA-binding CsgD family transcriptional regulator
MSFDSRAFESVHQQSAPRSQTVPGGTSYDSHRSQKRKTNMLSTEEIILKNSLSLLDPIEVTGIFCLGFSFRDNLEYKLDKFAAYPSEKYAELKNIFRTALSSKAFEPLAELNPSPFLSTLWTPNIETKAGGTSKSYILTKAFGPKGLTGLFLLEMKKVDLKTNNSVLEHAQQITQAAFSKIVLLGQTFRPESRLTPREKDIVKWIAYGKSNMEIAELMSISIHTVNGYLRAIYLKTNTTDRVSIGFYGLHNGLLD